jgi:hypothetical protein
MEEAAAQRREVEHKARIEAAAAAAIARSNAAIERSIAPGAILLTPDQERAIKVRWKCGNVTSKLVARHFISILRMSVYRCSVTDVQVRRHWRCRHWQVEHARVVRVLYHDEARGASARRWHRHYPTAIRQSALRCWKRTDRARLARF